MKLQQFRSVMALVLGIGLTTTIATAKTAGTPDGVQLAGKLRQAGMVFTENRGQIADAAGQALPDILFTARDGATTVFLTGTGIEYQFSRTIYPEGYKNEGLSPEEQARMEVGMRTELCHFSLSLAGANRHAHIVKEQKSSFRQNYYYPHCADGIVGVSSYEKITYEDVYPGIDWVVYSKGGHLKYDFVVHPGGNPEQIRLVAKDAQQVSITKAGELLMTTKLGAVKEDAPVSFANGRNIPTGFRRNSDGSIGFALGAWQAGTELTIDPSVSWATYFGGSAADQGLGCTTDASGNVYLVGIASSASLASSGAFQTVAAGGYDGIIVKFDPSGTLLWATYYGGTSPTDMFTGCATDAGGNVFVCGYTSSTGLASPSAFQTTLGLATTNGFLTKFDGSGVRQWATYYGGVTIFTTQFLGCATDPSGNVIAVGFAAGMTGDAGLEYSSTGTPFQSTNGGSQDGIIAKFDASGNRIWATYYGGTGSDQMRACATDASGNVFVGGGAVSGGLASSGAHQTSVVGSNDLILAKFDVNGNRLWATYQGGSGTDQAQGMVTDAAGDVYVVGLTGTPGGLATSDGYQTSNGGSNDMLYSKFSSTGSLLYSTYYGGTGDDRGFGVALDATGNAFVLGYGASAGLASGGFQDISGGGNDAVIVKFSAAGARMWASYLGGSGTENATGIAIQGSNIYVCGTTASTAGVSTAGAYQPAIGGSNDAYLAKIVDVLPASITTATTTPTALCEEASVAVAYTAAGTYTAGNIFTAELSDASGSFASPVTIGTLSATVSGTVTATIPTGTAAGAGYRIRVVSSTPVVTGTDNGTDIIITGLPVAGTLSGTGTVCELATETLTSSVTGGAWSSTNTAVATVSGGTVSGVAAGTSVISYTVTNSCGTAADSVTVTVNPLPVAGTLSGSDTVCELAAVTLTPSVTGGIWSSTDMAIATVSGGTVSGLAAGTSVISYAVSNSCGTAAATMTITVNPLPVAGTLSGSNTVCVSASESITPSATGGVWFSTNAVAATVAGGTVTGVAAGTSVISYTVTNGCGVAAATHSVTVNPLPDAGTVTGTAIACVGSTTTLASAASGGVWSSTDIAIGTVSTTGVVSGIANGTTTISYTVTNSCGVAAATMVVSVNTPPVAGSVSGLSSVCSGAVITLSSSIAGGVWSSSNAAVAAVSGSGDVTGSSAGTTTISYSVSTTCGSDVATMVVTVNAIPYPGVIAGAAYVCTGDNTPPLFDPVVGGSWSSANPAVGTVSIYGIVTGISAGTVLISYTVSNMCGTDAATHIVSVHPVPASVTGIFTVCQGAITMLSHPVAGGTWLSGDIAIAGVGAVGNVTGMGAGSANITYTTPAGCRTYSTVTVLPLPSAYSITGGGSYCAGGTGVHIGLSGSATGYDYQLYNGAATVGGSVGGTGLALDFGLLTASGVYSVSATNTATTCMAPMTGTASVNITPIVVPSVSVTASASLPVCAGTTAFFTATPALGGTSPAYQWSINGITAGSTAASFGYTPANGDIVRVRLTSNAICALPDTAIHSLTVAITPTVTPVVSFSASPDDTVCPGTMVTVMATPVAGGTAPTYRWTKNGTDVSIGSMYSFVPASGDIMAVTMSSNAVCRTADSVESSSVTFGLLTPTIPVVSIVAHPGTVIATGQSDTLIAIVTGATSVSFQWYRNNTLIAGATNATYISNTFNNGDSVTCFVDNHDPCGNPSFNSVHITVIPLSVTDPAATDLRILPNPNSGTFRLTGKMAADGDVVITVLNILGQEVYKGMLPVTHGTVDTEIRLDNALPAGSYILNILPGGERHSFHLTVHR